MKRANLAPASVPSSSIVDETPAPASAPTATPASECLAAIRAFTGGIASLQELKPLARLELACILAETTSEPIGKNGIGRPTVAMFLAVHAALNGASCSVVQEFARNANARAKSEGRGLPFRMSAKGQGASGSARWVLNTPAALDLAD